MVNATLEHFPGIRTRYMQLSDIMWEKHRIRPMYGLYWNFCLNWGRGSQFVKCLPHVDAMNIAIGLCSIFIFGACIVALPTAPAHKTQASSTPMRNAGYASGMLASSSKSLPVLL